MKLELTSEEVQILRLSMKNLINKTKDVKNLLYTTHGIETVNNTLKEYEEVCEKLKTTAESEC